MNPWTRRPKRAHADAADHLAQRPPSVALFDARRSLTYSTRTIIKAQSVLSAGPTPAGDARQEIVMGDK
jgi:hypothetical protein